MYTTVCMDHKISVDQTISKWFKCVCTNW
jgi:hypothetical protein